MRHLAWGFGVALIVSGCGGLGKLSVAEQAIVDDNAEVSTAEEDVEVGVEDSLAGVEPSDTGGGIDPALAAEAGEAVAVFRGFRRPTDEDLDVVVPRARLGREAVRLLLAELASAGYRAALDVLPGHRADPGMGEPLELAPPGAETAGAASAGRP